MILLRSHLYILFLFLNNFAYIYNTPQDGTYGGKCTRNGVYCTDNMLACQYTSSTDMEGICICKEGTSYIEGYGCKWRGNLHGFCNETIPCTSSHTVCSAKKGDGLCVCERFYDTINNEYNCEMIDTKGLLGGSCGTIKNKNYECTDSFTECVQISETFSECRCMKGYRTNPDTYKCEKVENGMLTSKCSSSNPCKDENTICSSNEGEGICICDYLNHYVMSNIQICEISYRFAKDCSNADDSLCDSLAYTCVNGLCLCSENYEINENYTDCEYKPPPVTEDTSYKSNSYYIYTKYLSFALLIIL